MYQGVVKFEELVQSVLDEVKDILPKWENKDVIEHLLADTDKKGNVIPSKKAIDYLSAKERLELEKNAPIGKYTDRTKLVQESVSKLDPTTISCIS